MKSDKTRKIRAFVSCSLREEDKPFVDRVEKIIVKNGFKPMGTIGRYSASPKPIWEQMKEGIKSADCLVLVATPRYIQQDIKDQQKTIKGLSEQLHTEVGMAIFGGLPVISFVLEGTDVGSFLPQVSQYITLKNDEHDIKSKQALIRDYLKNVRKIIEEKWEKSGSLSNSLQIEEKSGITKESRNLNKQVIGISSHDENHVDPNFREQFEEKLDLITNLLKDKRGLEVSDLIDNAIMLFKERIEKWDVPSVRFATREFFLRLYKFSEEDGLSEMYIFFEDLFIYAYNQRKHLIGSMMGAFNTILFESWIPNDDIEKGEKASKVMLKLAIDFLNKDLAVVRDCAGAIDNLAGDLFRPEILSKEILLATSLFEKDANSKEAQIFLQELVRWIKLNDQYSWDAETKAYLIDSINYAESEKEDYGIALEDFKQKFLYPALHENIDQEIQGYAQFLLEMEEGERQDNEISYETELLENIVLAYERVRPTVAKEIRQKVLELKHTEVLKTFNRIIDNSKILTKLYKGSDMITTLDELIQFLQVSAARSESDIGLTTYSPLMIEFVTKLNKAQKNALKNLQRKYDERGQMMYDVDDQELVLEPDFFVFENHQFKVKKLIEFLLEVNNISRIFHIALGISFNLR